ncbi:MAG: DNA mismatch repair protein MutS [Synergistaceae bacterium]|nr:DNA mismatch repair protein MutS [Synergistaceae bacterium]
MLEQYLHWKEQYPDSLLFFRMGDFYEMFFEDAQVASSVLDIALTSRSRDSENAIPMAGVPFHSVEPYLGKLVAAGYRVAICEQVTVPDGKTLVQREVTRLVTPGTWLSDSSGSDGNLVSCCFDGKNVSLAFLTAATGSLRAGTFSSEEASSLLFAFRPDEILIRKGQDKELSGIYHDLARPNVVEREKGEFDPKTGSEWLCRKWEIASLSCMGIDDRDPAAGASAAALRYLEETQFSQASHIKGITPVLPSQSLILDHNTVSNLELTEPSDVSLFSVLNRCRTAMGRRNLKEWILYPLQDIAAIEKRQDSIEELVKDNSLRINIQRSFSACGDVEKAVSRLTLNMGYPSDIVVIRETLRALPVLITLMSQNEKLRSWADGVDALEGLFSLLESSISENVPRFVRDGGVIKNGFDRALDEWRDKAANSSSWLHRFEESERERTGIKNLKAGVNKVFGYYIEIPKGGLNKAPAEYIRKQTLVNAERFITEELKIFEKEMFRSEEEILSIEDRIYSEIVAAVLSNSSEILEAAKFIAVSDVFSSLAEIASERRYVRPVMEVGTDFIVKNGRHPVIEITLGKHPFTPNDLSLSAVSGKRIAIITGPNMAGKSTYLRMAALIAIMAHMGSFVPAESAKIGIIDRVFTRIGARDELARGQSTFMVEMVETANILRNATDRSLVILDEVGRGTSTYDGLSIAWSVIEYLQGQEGRKAAVLFATHYHELTKLAEKLPGITNLSMAVEEGRDGVTFLHKVVEAPSDRSYGIEVAKLAGVPALVLRRSKELLAGFEAEANEGKSLPPVNEESQMKLFDVGHEAILEELAASEPDEMTPMEALQIVYRLRKESRKVLGFK